MHTSAAGKRVRTWLGIGTASTALLAGIAPAAFGQAAPDQSGVETITVTAQRRSEDIQQVPVSVTAFSGSEIQNAGVKETEDIGQLIPNVTIVTPEGAGNQPIITIRGIGLNDFDSNNAGPNGLYVDDVFISAPAAQSFGIFDIDQVQVLKGPQGTLYGRNTSGGAIVFTTKQPTDQFTTDWHVEYGEFNTAQVQGAVGGPITDTLDARLAFVYNHSDGYMNNLLTGGAASGTDNEAARLQLLWKPNADLKILFSSTIGYLQDQPIEYRHVGTLVPGTQGSASPGICSPSQALAGGCVDLFGATTPAGFYDGQWSRNEEMHNLNQIDQLRIDYNWDPIELTSISAYQHNNKYHPEDTDAGPFDTVRASYGVKSDAFTQELRATQNADNFHWVAGFFYLHEDLHQDQPLSLFYNGDLYGGLGIPAGAGNFDGVAQESTDLGHQTTDSPAFYTQADYTIDDLTLTLGGRFTYERKTFDYFGSTQFQLGGLGHYGPATDIITASEEQSNTDFTWKAAASYKFTPDIMSYVSISTGFKSGDFNGSFLSNDPQQALFQLQPVKPEHVTSYEIGAKTSFFDRHLIINGAAFYNDYQDEQVFAAVPQVLLSGAGPIEEVTQVITNAKQAHTEGLELEVVGRPMPGLTISAQPAALNTRLDDAGLPGFGGTTSLDGKELANSPHFSFAGGINYKWVMQNDDDISIGWNSNYKSHQFFDSTNDPYIQQNGYWLHNFDIAYQSDKGWEVGAFIHNVTGTKYFLTSTDLTSPFGVLTPVVGPPQTFGFQASYSY